MWSSQHGGNDTAKMYCMIKFTLYWVSPASPFPASMPIRAHFKGFLLLKLSLDSFNILQRCHFKAKSFQIDALTNWTCIVLWVVFDFTLCYKRVNNQVLLYTIYSLGGVVVYSDRCIRGLKTSHAAGVSVTQSSMSRSTVSAHNLQCKWHITHEIRDLYGLSTIKM